MNNRTLIEPFHVQHNVFIVSCSTIYKFKKENSVCHSFNNSKSSAFHYLFRHYTSIVLKVSCIASRVWLLLQIIKPEENHLTIHFKSRVGSKHVVDAFDHKRVDREWIISFSLIHVKVTAKVIKVPIWSVTCAFCTWKFHEPLITPFPKFVACLK